MRKPPSCFCPRERLGDHVRSDGTDLDTAAALRDRIPALGFTLERFDVVQGRVAIDGAHVEPAVARKR